MQTSKIKIMTMMSLMTAILCILGPITMPIPISPVPISLVTLIIYLSVYILGMKRGTISCLLYLLIGFVGLPVFSGFTGGVGRLLGPTGGYMIGYAFMAVISGFFIERWITKRVLHMVGMVLGTIICYLFGTIWLSMQAGMSFSVALGAGVVPFLIGDSLKIIMAVSIGPLIRKRLKRAGLLPDGRRQHGN